MLIRQSSTSFLLGLTEEDLETLRDNRPLLGSFKDLDLTKSENLVVLLGEDEDDLEGILEEAESSAQFN